jgi:hypothetical protein
VLDWAQGALNKESTGVRPRWDSMLAGGHSVGGAAAHQQLLLPCSHTVNGTSQQACIKAVEVFEPVGSKAPALPQHSKLLFVGAFVFYNTLASDL